MSEDKTQEIPVVKCPIDQNEFPLDQFKCSVDEYAIKVYPRNIHLWCPDGHLFNLSTATKGGMITKEQGKIMVSNAQMAVWQNRLQKLGESK